MQHDEIEPLVLVRDHQSYLERFRADGRAEETGRLLSYGGLRIAHAELDTIDLSAAVTANASFAQVHFRNCTFGGWEANGSAFIDCKFNRCSLVKADLSATKAERVIFHECRFFRTQLSDALLADCQYIDCEFDKVGFHQTEVARTHFIRCSFDRCDFTGSIFRDSSVRETTHAEVLELTTARSIGTFESDADAFAALRLTQPDRR